MKSCVFLPLLTVLISIFAISCNKQKPTETVATIVTDSFVLNDENLEGDILFIGGYHEVTNHKGEVVIAKQNHDFTGYIPIDDRSDSGYVIVNHELNLKNDVLGDGGGMTVFTVYKNPKSSKWEVVEDSKGKYRNVDFSSVGGTFMNCGGFQTKAGTILTAEETIFKDNDAIFRDGEGITDTSNFLVEIVNGERVDTFIQKHENFNWMVEVDVANAKAIRKNYNMGRYTHEGGTVLPDGKTVFLTDDLAPGYIYKFVAEKENDFSKGQLYVYKQNVDGIGGSWVEMPMDLKSLINASSTVAPSLGATIFIRTEWAVYHNGKVYFTETGTDDTGIKLQSGVAKGAHLAIHLQQLDEADGNKDNRLNDYYGRILEMDMETGYVRVYLAGGAGAQNHFSNPDGLALTYINKKPVIMVNEDLIGTSHGRVPATYNQRINEIFCLDLTIENPTVDDLHKLAVGPEGCETTGGRFTTDGSTYFVNIQHPKSTNEFPYNNSVTVAVRGVDEWIKKSLKQ